MSEDLARYVAVSSADVYKGGRHAGTLTRIDGGVEFRYLDAYLSGDGPAVATTLPRSDEPVRTGAGAVPPFFAGLLPEGRRLIGLQRAVKTSADDELSLLLVVGRDTVGDVQVVPAGERPTLPEPSVAVDTDWSEVRFADLLDAAGIDRVAIPGVQDKVSAGMIALPLAARGERYILKLDPPEFPHVVEDEAFFLARARQAKIPTAEARVVRDADDRPGLLVTRFDRRLGVDGEIEMVACEDACQVAGRWPADKYRLSSEEVALALIDRCAAGVVAGLNLFRQFCFAWLTGNGDLHAKNVSIVRGPGAEWRVSPAYDLPSTLPYGDTSFALALQGATTNLSRRRLLAFGVAIGVPIRAAEEALEGILERLAALEREVGGLPFPQKTIADLRAAIRYRRVAAKK